MKFETMRHFDDNYIDGDLDGLLFKIVPSYDPSVVGGGNSDSESIYDMFLDYLWELYKSAYEEGSSDGYDEGYEIGYEEGLDSADGDLWDDLT